MSVGQDELTFNSSVTGSSSGGADTGVPYSNTKGSFFANIADVERLAGGTVCKKWFLYNGSGLYGLISPSIWLSQEPTYITEELGLGWNSADDDDETQGNMTAFSGNAVAALASSASDTRDVTLVGLDAAGDPQFEVVTLNGTTEVLSTGTWSVLYGGMVDSVSGSLSVSIKEDTAGTVRGTIGPTFKSCWLWVEPLSKGGGIHLPDLAPGDSYGFWDRITWAAATAGVRPNISVVAIEEN